MVFPEPAEAPVTLPAGVIEADHVNVVPGVWPERIMSLVAPEQIV